MDREKVVSHLQIINTWATVDLRSPKEPIWSYRTLEDVKQWTDDAIALLKEQDAIVRCKDCKKRYTVLCIQEEAGNINNQDDWFCADGVKKDA